MRVPSGDHTGDASAPGSTVRRDANITGDIDDPDVAVSRHPGSQCDGNAAFVW